MQVTRLDFQVCKLREHLSQSIIRMVCNWRVIFCGYGFPNVSIAYYIIYSVMNEISPTNNVIFFYLKFILSALLLKVLAIGLPADITSHYS